MNVLDTICYGCGKQLDVYTVGITSIRLPDGRYIQVCCNGGTCWNLAKNQPQQLDLFT